MKHRFLSLPLGIQLASAALIVSVPRYIIAFLRADRIGIHVGIEAVMLVVSAVATAVTLTGGAAYVAHAVSVARGHIFKRSLLVCAWLVLLAFEIVLLAPPLLATLRAVPLAGLLAGWLDAAWSIVAIAAPAATAAACVLAASLETQKPQPLPAPATALSQPSVAPAADPAPNEPVAALEVAPVPLTCEHCERSFDTVNALNAHRWRCKAKRATEPLAVSANGHHAG